MSAPLPNQRHDVDLICWRCRRPLIKDFFVLMKLAEPAPVFCEVNMHCLGCNALNHWPRRGSAPHDAEWVTSAANRQKHADAPGPSFSLIDWNGL